MTIVVAVVRVVVVVIPVDGHRTMRMMPWTVRLPSIGGIRAVPSPTVVEAAAIPEGIVVVGTIVVVWPPPIVAHVNT